MIRALIAAVLAAGAVHAADDVRVRTTLLPQGRVSDTTQLRLVIQIEGSSIPDVSTPQLPQMKNLRIVGGPSTAHGSSYVFDNGRIVSSSSQSFTYFLAPLGPGPAEVPAFDLSIGGMRYRTEPLHVQVEAGRAGPAPPPGTRREEPADEDADGSVDVFLQTRLRASSVWSGQPTVLDITLYAGAPVSDFGWTDLPSLGGLWSEDLPLDPDYERRTVTMNGRAYAAYTVARKLIVPTGAGSLTIPPFTAQLQVRRSARDPFGTFFSLGRSINILRKTAPVKLEVKPLPEAGRPSEFSGAVGSFRMKVGVDRSTVELGEAVAIRATLEGEGSLQSVHPPTIPAPPDVKVYEPKVVEDTTVGASHLGARKTWEWVVVPLAPGTVKLPEPSFSYFDVGSGTYKALGGEIAELTVRRGTGTFDPGMARGEVQPNTKDIAFVKARRGALEESRPPVHERAWFTAMLVLPFLLAPVGIVLGRRRARYLSDHGFARSRRAARTAARRLARAEGRPADGSTAFHQEVAGALVDYVADRANRSAAGLTYDELEDILAAKGAPADLRRRYRSCLEACDFARFVPDAARSQARTELLREAREILRAIEAVA
ncbi:MAG TPA: BatD family protein [Candidatus Polarisedimenticolaceae bacterium]|nr:BatD family protein [Candidatus Polarisedimenticolaceae bacterium]